MHFIFVHVCDHIRFSWVMSLIFCKRLGERSIRPHQAPVAFSVICPILSSEWPVSYSNPRIRSYVTSHAFGVKFNDLIACHRGNILPLDELTWERSVYRLPR